MIFFFYRFLEEKLEINNIYNKFTLKDIILSHGLNYNKDRKETNFEDISYEMFSNFELKSIEEKNQSLFLPSFWFYFADMTK